MCEVEVEVEVTTCDLERHTFLLFRTKFLDRTNEGMKRRGRQDIEALRISFCTRARHITTLRRERGGILGRRGRRPFECFCFCFCFSRRRTQNGSIPQPGTRVSVSVAVFCAFPLYSDDSKGDGFFLYWTFLVNYFCETFVLNEQRKTFLL